MEAERELLPVASCTDTGYSGVECVKYGVRGGSGVTLSRLAKRYSSKEFKLSVDLLLAFNPHIAKREVPEPLRGYSAPPWNRTSADWLFDGDEITLPFVFEDDVEMAESKKTVGALVGGLVKENDKLRDQRNVFGIALLVFVILAVVLFMWALNEHGSRRRNEDQRF